MDISFDYETKQKVLKVNAEEEALIIQALTSLSWNTHSDFTKIAADDLFSQLVRDSRY